MSVRELSFNYIEKKMRKKNFGFLGTLNPEGTVHLTGIMYAVSPNKETLNFYILTGKTTKKIKNIQLNPSVSLVIPFPHYFIRFAPEFYIHVQGNAKILPFNEEKAQIAMQSRRLMRRMIKKIPLETTDEVIICIKLDKKIHGFGLGMNLFKLLKNIENGRFKAEIPNEFL